MTAQQQTLAGVAAAALKVKIDRLVGVASSIASSSQMVSDVSGGQWAAAAGVARDLQNNVNYYDPFIDRVIIYDASATQQSAYPALVGGLGTNASSSDWYKELIMGGNSSYVSGVTRRISLPQIQVIDIVTPVVSHDKIVGFVVLQIPTDNFLEFGGNLSLGTYGFAYVVDAKGHIVAHPKFFSNNSGIVDYSYVSQVQKVLAGKNGTDIVVDPGSGEKSLISYASVDEYGWGIVTQELYSEAFSSVGTLLSGIIILIVLCSLFDICLAYGLFRYLTKQGNA